MLCADLKSWKKSPERYWKNVPKEVQDFLISSMGPFYEGKEQMQRDEAMRSCGIAGSNSNVSSKIYGI